MAKYIDTWVLAEDRRIDMIGEAAMQGDLVAFITDDHKDEPDKMARYIRKLTKKFPELCIMDQFKGPVANTCSARIVLRICYAPYGKEENGTYRCGLKDGRHTTVLERVTCPECRKILLIGSDPVHPKDQ